MALASSDFKNESMRGNSCNNCLGLFCTLKTESDCPKGPVPPFPLLLQQNDERSGIFQNVKWRIHRKKQTHKYKVFFKSSAPSIEIGEVKNLEK